MVIVDVTPTLSSLIFSMIMTVTFPIVLLIVVFISLSLKGSSLYRSLSIEVLKKR